MKTLMLAILTTLAFQAHAAPPRECASWDTFCKSPEQITATKCRLGVPVYHDQCKELGVPSHYMARGGGSLVNAMPVTEYNKQKNNK